MQVESGQLEGSLNGVKPVVLVLSPGRAGTKYVADVLRMVCHGQAEVWHERLNTAAEARALFRRYSPSVWEGVMSSPGPVAAMMESIRGSTREKSYLDTGWTLHSLFPLFALELGPQVRFVMQIRHPFDAAASHAIRGAYRSEWTSLAPWQEHCFLQPCDNAFHPDVAWQKMTPFEKCLWRWGELVLYWEELRQKFPEHVFQIVRAEEVFRTPDTLLGYLELLEIEGVDSEDLLQASEQARRNQTRSDWQYWWGLGLDWRRYFSYGYILEIAQRYGYSSDPPDIEAKARNYRKPRQWGRRLLRRMRLSSSMGESD